MCSTDYDGVTTFYHPKRMMVGDKVCRDERPIHGHTFHKHGEVINVWSHFSKHTGYYPELYMVQFEDGTVRRGFFRHGLELLKRRIFHVHT